MPVRARSVRLPTRIVVLFGLLLSCSVALADSSGKFLVTDVQTGSIGDALLLDAHFAITLSKGAREALQSGVPLTLEFQVQLVRENSWLWDVIEAEHVLARQLHYYALGRSYQLRDKNSKTIDNYSTLEDALAAAGTIDRLLLTSQPLRPGHDYLVRLRGSVNIEALPTPVRLLAYVSSDWDTDSDWYSWPLDR